MLEKQLQTGKPSGKQLTVALAANIYEVREAQRLRYLIFAEEMGARVPGWEQGIDCDIYDAYCHHLLVRDADSSEIVGTYRILSGAQARRLGRFYSDEKFDLTRLHHLRNVTMEVGRSCVHPNYRTGATIALLWSGLCTYLLQHGCQYLMGCASISMADGGHGAASIYRRLAETHLSPDEFRVFPRLALLLEGQDDGVEARLPPLIKGYIRVGCYVCGAPAWDPAFNTAILLMLLPLARFNPRYARHFLKAAPVVSRFDSAHSRGVPEARQKSVRPAMAAATLGHPTSRAIQFLRLARVGLHIARGAVIAALVFPFTIAEGRRVHVKRWSRKLLEILAVRLQVNETPPRFTDTPLMLVANHISWLDVIAINAVLPVRFVAKSEVRSWAVIGWMSEKVGTLFICRTRRRDILRVNEQLAQALRDGDPVAVFPEATTTDGTTVVKFQSSLLQPAVLVSATLCPVALRYTRMDGTPCAEAAFIGSRTFWDSLNLMVTQAATLVDVAFLAPIQTTRLHRRELASGAREAILRSMFPPTRGIGTRTHGDPPAALR